MLTATGSAEPTSNGWTVTMATGERATELEMEWQAASAATRGCPAFRSSRPPAKRSPKQATTAGETQPSVLSVNVVAALKREEAIAGAQPVAVALARCGDLICMSAGSAVILLDAAKKEQKAAFQLGCGTIHCAAFSSSGTFLAIGDAERSIQFIHIESEAVVFSFNISTLLSQLELSKFEGRLSWMGFVGDSGRDCPEEFIIVLGSSAIARFANLNLVAFEAAVLNKDEEAAANARETIELDMTELSAFNECKMEKVAEVAVWRGVQPSIRDRIFLAGTGSTPLTVWKASELGELQLADFICDDVVGNAILHIEVSPDGEYLAMLDADRGISVWNADTLLLLHYMDHFQATGFTLQQPVVNEEPHMGFIIHALTADNLHVVTYPSMDTVQSFNVGKACSFVSSTNQDKHSAAATEGEPSRYTLFLIEETLEGRIFVRGLSEVLPVARMSVLIHQGRFDDAVSVATEYGLDIELVVKEKWENILLQRRKSIFQEAHDDNTLVREAETDLNSIADVDFVAKICLSLPLLSPDSTQKLLDFGRQVFNIRSFELEQTSAVSSIFVATKRFSTFKLLNELSGKTFNWEEWEHFRSCSMVTEICNLLAGGQLEAAVLIWRRHHCDDNLGPSVPQILSSLPDSLRLENYDSWLSSELIPSALFHGLDQELSKWICDRAHAVELQEKQPYAAFQLISMLNQSCATLKDASAPGLFVNAVTKTAFHQTMTDPISAQLYSQLSDIVYLWDVHDFKVSLLEYSQTEPSSIALDLLSRAGSSETLSFAIEKNFKPYCKHHQLDCEDLLAEFALEVMDTFCGEQNINVGGAPWESKILVVASRMERTDRWSSTVFEVMTRSPIPWTSLVEELIHEALGASSPFWRKSIEGQFRLMQLRKILQDCGLTNFNISNSAEARGLLEHLLQNVQNVSAMALAHKVLDVYPHLTLIEAFMIRLRHLFKNGLHERGMQLLLTGAETDETGRSSQSLLENEKLVVISETLAWLLENINSAKEKEGAPEFLQVYRAAQFRWSINAAIQLTKAHQSCFEGTEVLNIDQISGIKDLHQVLINLRDLYDEFGIRINPKDFVIDEAHRRSIVSQFAKAVFNYNQNKSPKSQSGALTKTQLYRLAEILGFERSSLTGVIAEEAAANGDFQTSFLLCKELLEKYPDSASAPTLKRIGFLMTKFASENKVVFQDMQNGMNAKLTSWILELSRKALSICDTDLLNDCLDNFKDYELLHAIFNNTVAGNYNVLSGNTAAQGSAFPRNAAAPTTSLASQTLSEKYTPSSSSSSPASPNDLELLSLQDDYGTELFQSHFNNGSLVLSTSEAMQQAFSCVSACTNGAAASNSSLKEKSSTAEPSELCRQSAVYLRKNKLLCMSLRMFQRSNELAERNSLNSKIPKIIGSEMQDCYHNLVKDILSARYIDKNLALNCMLSLPRADAFEVFKYGTETASGDFTRLLDSSAIGQAAGLAWNQMSLQVMCRDISKNAYWWNILDIFGVKVDVNRFLLKEENGNEYRRELIPLLIQQSSYDLDMALDYAECYDVPSDFVILEYVRQLLLSDTRSADCQPLVASVIDDVVNKESLVALLLKTCLPAVSPYDYERIKLIFQQVQRLKPDDVVPKRGLLIVEILSAFVRTTAPSAEEIKEANDDAVDEAKAAENIKSIFVDCAKRLPFHGVLSDPWVYLGPELNSETLPRLFPLCTPLRLEEDEFYSHVVKVLIQKLNIETDSRGKVMVEIRSLLSQIQNQRLALSLCTEAAEFCPVGADRIGAFRTAVAICERWLKSVKDEDEFAVADDELNRARSYLLFSETEHQLRSMGLEDFVQFLPDHLMLVQQLYWQKSDDALKSKGDLDLNGLVSDLGKRYKFDVASFKNNLFTMYISRPPQFSEEEKKLYLPSSRIQSGNLAASHEERKLQRRAVYLLKSVDLQKGVAFCLTCAYNEKTTITTVPRIKSLLILFQLIADNDYNNGPELNFSLDGVKTDLQYLLYMADFEELRIVQSLNEFKSVDKAALARSLWVHHGREPKALQLILNICLDYKIYDLTLWENSLKRLIELSAVKYVLGIIENVVSNPVLWRMARLEQIWNDLLVQSFKLMLANNGDDDRFNERAVSLLQKSPFILENRLVDQITALGRTANEHLAKLAATSLWSIPSSNQQKSSIHGVLSRHAKSVVPMLVCRNAADEDEALFRRLLHPFRERARRQAREWIAENEAERVKLLENCAEALKELMAAGSETSGGLVMAGGGEQ
ncbi:rough deal protein C-terminal region-domain-containing protein [Zopfochytrium polystomum]|nr:rough deal protein C-terminal region-domain-containing protein [Zopfochytrium polystomum]